MTYSNFIVLYENINISRGYAVSNYLITCSEARSTINFKIVLYPSSHYPTKYY